MKLLLIWILGKSFAELERENAEEILWMELISTAGFCIVQIANKSFTVPSQQKWTQKSFKKRNESQYFVNLRKPTAFIPRCA